MNLQNAMAQVEGYAYRWPFWQPLPIADWWYLLLVPLCLGIAIVYKCVKCNPMDRVAREAIRLCVEIIVVLVVVAALLAGLVKLIEA